MAAIQPFISMGWLALAGRPMEKIWRNAQDLDVEMHLDPTGSSSTSICKHLLRMFMQQDTNRDRLAGSLP